MKEKVLVLTRATPEESRKYGYKVCVAGITENGEWRRLYPFTFQYGKVSLPFGKKDIIEVETEKNSEDARKESRKVRSFEKIPLPKDDREIVRLLNGLVCTVENMKNKGDSLCVIKPEIAGLDIIINDMNICDEQTYFSLSAGLGKREKTKIPIECSYIFTCGGECCGSRSHKMIIIDWEVNELARNVLKSEPNKTEAERKIRAKLFHWMKTREVYFILGTHFKWKTPMIIGIYYPSSVAAGQSMLKEFQK